MNKRDVYLLNLYTSMWGFWVLNPAWDTFSRSKIYANLEYIFPEYIWGGGALLIGLLSVYAVTRNHFNLLKILSKAGSILWFVIAILYISIDYRSTGWITATIVAAFYFLKAINISVNGEKAFNKQ